VPSQIADPHLEGKEEEEALNNSKKIQVPKKEEEIEILQYERRTLKVIVDNYCTEKLF